MRPRVPLPLICSALISLHLAASAVELPSPPSAVDSRLKVQLVAMEPDVRTPTSIQVDGKGRVWVLENNTHFRPKNYDGPPTDRVLVMEDFGPDGRARRITPWAEGFRDGMSLFLLPKDGGVLVSTRAETIRFHDKDGDGRADERTTILKMESKDEYPHNGLSGLAMGPDGKMYLGLGENHGEPWVLTGSDGTEIRGSDEGAIFRFNPDGTGLEWWALGVWNPFGLAFRSNGQLFALDNDPSGGSLCRLLHVVRGGDYGYRYRYGRTIEHPFISWFGTIPGTLPPVTLVGEAPCGMMSYKGGSVNAFPAEYQGELIGTTWSDHGLQRFPLTPKGASYTSKPEFIVKGGNYFRPSGVAEAPDGSLLVSDWVDGSYEVHGKGRVWRVSNATPGVNSTNNSPSVAPAGKSPEEGVAAFTSKDPFVFHQAILAAAEKGNLALLLEKGRSAIARERLAALLALRRTHAKGADQLLTQWLGDTDGAVRRAALQWISEAGRKDLLPQLGKALEGQPTRGTFMAYLAAIQMLESGKPDPAATTTQTAAVALDESRAPELRALALRLLPPTFAGLANDSLIKLSKDGNAGIRLEAVRMLAARSDEPAQAELRSIAGGSDGALALEAVAGLALSKDNPETKKLLNSFGATNIGREAQRSLGTVRPFGEQRDAGEILASTGDAAAGRRLFYHPNGPRCFSCHAVEGRGANVGPDLTQLGHFTPEQLLEAIRNPSKDIAPAYAMWHVKMKDGTEGVGIDLFEDNKSTVTLIDATGQKTKYAVANMVEREVMPVSMMPPGLDLSLTRAELRDLIAFLRESRE